MKNIDKFSDIYRCLHQYWRSVFNWGPAPEVARSVFGVGCGLTRGERAVVEKGRGGGIRLLLCF